MNRRLFLSLEVAVTLVALLLVLPPAAKAGPPLVCWPFEIGGAKSLPWSSDGWRETQAGYDLNRLVEDTLALLTPQTPVIVRMETLRRATVYGMKDQIVAAELYASLRTRAAEADAKGKPDALALFDLGYLVEAYKQAGMAFKNIFPVKGVNGYDLAVRASGLSMRNPEMEFALALMTVDNRNAMHGEHLKLAVAGAPEGSLLARNLISHFENRGKTFAELRSNVGVAKN